MTTFFSDMGIKTGISEVYDRVGEPEIDVKEIVLADNSPQTNNERRVSWAHKFHEATGRFPSLNGMEEHECRYCHKPVYYPMGSNPSPFKVFCSDECELDYKEMGSW